MSQHRLQFALRGAEWAFAIPDGDLAALEEVAAICCDFWNGANSLVIAIGEDGSLNADTDTMLDIRDVERVFVHERVDEARRTPLIERFGLERITQIWPEMTRHELHPLNLQPTFRDPPAGGAHLALPIPVYDDEALARVGRVAWGRIDQGTTSTTARPSFSSRTAARQLTSRWSTGRSRAWHRSHRAPT